MLLEEMGAYLGYTIGSVDCALSECASEGGSEDGRNEGRFGKHDDLIES